MDDNDASAVAGSGESPSSMDDVTGYVETAMSVIEGLSLGDDSESEK
jgi:hypothetical protein